MGERYHALKTWYLLMYLYNDMLNFSFKTLLIYLSPANKSNNLQRTFMPNVSSAFTDFRSTIVRTVSRYLEERGCSMSATMVG